MSMDNPKDTAESPRRKHTPSELAVFDLRSNLNNRFVILDTVYDVLNNHPYGFIPAGNATDEQFLTSISILIQLVTDSCREVINEAVSHIEKTE